MKNKQKKILLSAVSVLLAAALILGIGFGLRNRQKDPVIVVPFDQIGMTEYWGDRKESHGPVSSDNIQTVYLSDTQTVTEVLVKEGDTVKKGDPMMTFDTTLSSLDVERKRLEVEKLKLDLIDDEARLRQILGMRPMQLPPELPEQEQNLGTELTKPYRISGKPGFDGSSAEAPLVVWLREDTDVDQKLIDEILEYALNIRVGGLAPQKSAPSADTDPEPQENGAPDGDVQTGAPGTDNKENLSQTPDTENKGEAPKAPDTENKGEAPKVPDTENKGEVPKTPDTENKGEAPKTPNTENKGEPPKAPDTENKGEPPKTPDTENKEEPPKKEETQTPKPEEPSKPSVVQPANRNNMVAAVVTAQKLVFYASPSSSAAVVAEKSCHQATVRTYEQVTAEGVKWAFTVLGIGDYAVEGWVQVDGNLQLQEVNPILPQPDQPTDPTIPEVKMYELQFNIHPATANAVVTLRRESADASFERRSGNNFLASSGIYSFSVEAEGYKPVIVNRLKISDKDVQVPVFMESYQDLSKLNSVYVIFKTTEDNMSLGTRTLWQGMKLYQQAGFRLFDATLIPDYTMAADLSGEDEAPEFDMGSGMTAAQIAELRADQEKKIEDTKLKVKMAEAEYKIKKRELEDGNIYAEFDGKVVSLLTEEESRKSKKPMIKVSGGGGYEVEGSVNELDREKMKIGQKVTVNDWNSGETYEGEIISIGEFPLPMRGYRGQGNPNSSYYPFRAFVDGEANLQTGSYVNIQYSAEDAGNGIYLENPFLREEKGKSYVYVLGEKDRLEKRFVTTGKALWGSYTEITSGLSEEDYLAFPYGKNVKPGVKAKVGDMGDLYR